MSIFVKSGINGQIKTWPLPSGDLSVTGPASGPLEQIMFEACGRSGIRSNAGGTSKGWIIPSRTRSAVIAALKSRCIKIS
jgi:hypothetical protein